MIFLNVQVKHIQNLMVFIITFENVHLRVYLVQMYRAFLTNKKMLMSKLYAHNLSLFHHSLRSRLVREMTISLRK